MGNKSFILNKFISNKYLLQFNEFQLYRLSETPFQFQPKLRSLSETETSVGLYSYIYIVHKYIRIFNVND